MEITSTDRILRELSIIEKLYRSQYEPKSISPLDVSLVMEKGDSLREPRFINTLHIHSEHPLFNLQEFKANIEQRFEASSSSVLLKNQLVKVYNRAAEVKELYMGNLRAGSSVVEAFKGDIERRRLEDTNLHPRERFSWVEFYSATATVFSSALSVIYFGKSNISFKEGLKYNYLANNEIMLFFCDSLIDFIHQFEVIDSNIGPSPLGVSDLSAYEIALRFYYLNKLGKASGLTPREIADRYSVVFNKSHDNIRTAWGEIIKKEKNHEPLGSRKQLENVKKHCFDYPDIIKAIDNDLQKIS